MRDRFDLIRADPECVGTDMYSPRVRARWQRMQMRRSHRSRSNQTDRQTHHEGQPWRGSRRLSGLVFSYSHNRKKPVARGRAPCCSVRGDRVPVRVKSQLDWEKERKTRESNRADRRKSMCESSLILPNTNNKVKDRLYNIKWKWRC